MTDNNNILEVKDLSVDFASYGGEYSVIRNCNYTVKKGEVMAIVGESGSGKSVLTQTTVRLTPGVISSGQILFEGKDLASLSEHKLDEVRGRDISIIFQDAMTALNPTMRIGDQIIEVLMKHFVFTKAEMHQFTDELLESLKTGSREEVIPAWLTEYFRPTGKQMEIWTAQITEALDSADPKAAIVRWIKEEGNLTKERAKNAAIEILKMIKIPDPEKRLKQYIFQFSGGMRQRIMVAIALACRPKLLIADEPTTALDVTIKAEVLNMIISLVRELNSSIILITHDLGIVASYADRIGVMYAGEFVETGTSDEIFYNPQHPYTRGLLKSIPRLDTNSNEDLSTVDGAPPNLAMLPKGCPFHPRCECAMEICRQQCPGLKDLSDTHSVRCWLQDERAAEVRKQFGYEEVKA